MEEWQGWCLIASVWGVGAILSSSAWAQIVCLFLSILFIALWVIAWIEVSKRDPEANEAEAIIADVLRKRGEND